MVSKITFLGSSGDVYNYAKQYRASGGFVLKVDDAQFHIDPGPGATTKAAEYGVNLRENTAVLVTHNHLGHCNDINTVIDAMTYGGLDRKGILICNDTILNGTEKIRGYLTDFHKKCVERIIVLKPEKRVGIMNIDIIGTFAKHSDENAIGFKFITPNFTLGYTGDTEITNKIVEQYQGCDVLILNVVAPSGVKIKGQLNSDDAVIFLNKVKPKLAIITHFGLKMLRADPLYEAREIQSKTNIQVVAAKDGMIVSPGNYAAKSKQKNLLNMIRKNN